MKPVISKGERISGILYAEAPTGTSLSTGCKAVIEIKQEDGDEKISTTGELTRQGEFEFSLTPEKSGRYRISAIVDDALLGKGEISSSFIVLSGELKIIAFPSGQVKSGVENRFYVFTCDETGRPVSCKVNVQAGKTILDFPTGADGTATFMLKPGEEKKPFKVIGKDEKQRKGVITCYFPPEKGDLNIDFTEVSPGTGKVRISAWKFLDQPLITAIYSNGTLLECSSGFLKNGKWEGEINLPGQAIGPLEIRILTGRSKKSFSTWYWNRPDPIGLTCVFNREKYLPGEMGEVKLKSENQLGLASLWLWDDPESACKKYLEKAVENILYEELPARVSSWLCHIPDESKKSALLSWMIRTRDSGTSDKEKKTSPTVTRPENLFSPPVNYTWKGWDQPSFFITGEVFNESKSHVLTFPVLLSQGKSSMVVMSGLPFGYPDFLEGDFSVFQEFVYGLRMPPKLTVGDVIQLPLRISNYGPVKKDAIYGLVPGSWYETTRTGDIVTSVPAGKCLVSFLPMEIKEPGEHKFTIYIRAGKIGEGLRKNVRVVPNGHPYRRGGAGILKKKQRFTFNFSQKGKERKVRISLYPGYLAQVIQASENLPGKFAGNFFTTAFRLVSAIEKGKISGDKELLSAYQDMLNYRSPDGGFSRRRAGKSELITTVWAGFIAGKLHGTPCNTREIKDSCINYIFEKMKQDGSWSEGIGPLPREIKEKRDSRLTSYILWLISETEKTADIRPGLDYIEKFIDTDDPVILGA
ncbi:MAG: hypothetical protein J7M18_06925, partial [Candidatus Eremiobacteraeota bacterium]|nr:hypothetical protein [Candidatus Eremiobacteraeota bacterium]